MQCKREVNSSPLGRVNLRANLLKGNIILGNYGVSADRACRASEPCILHKDFRTHEHIIKQVHSYVKKRHLAGQYSPQILCN